MSVTEVKLKVVTGTFAAGANRTSVTAAVDTNWKFLCWLQPASRGWVGFVYPEGVGTQTSNFWTTDSTNAERNFNAFYLEYQ